MSQARYLLKAIKNKYKINVNLKNNNLNGSDIVVELYDEDYLMFREILSPNEELLTIDVVDVKSSYILKIKSKNFIGNRVDKVLRLDVENIDNVDFYEYEYTE